MFIAFRKAEICKNPECEFDKEDIRFYHRFKLFTEINSPAIVPYEVYLQNIEAIQSDNNSVRKINSFFFFFFFFFIYNSIYSNSIYIYLIIFNNLTLYSFI